MDDDDSLCRPLESLEDGECEPDCTCIGCVLANTTQDDPPPPPDEPDEPLPPIQLEQTRRKKAALHGQDLLPKVLCILDAISNEGLTLSLFLNALSWGDESCTANDRVRFARTGLLLSEELPDILARWYKPPRNKNKGRRPASATFHELGLTIRLVRFLLYLFLEDRRLYKQNRARLQRR